VDLGAVAAMSTEALVLWIGHGSDRSKAWPIKHFDGEPGLGCDSAFCQGRPAAASLQGPVIRATTRLVVLNVVVYNKKGIPVGGLSRDDSPSWTKGKNRGSTFFRKREPIDAR
jgi:hypothetical protein